MLGCLGQPVDFVVWIIDYVMDTCIVMCKMFLFESRRDCTCCVGVVNAPLVGVQCNKSGIRKKNDLAIWKVKYIANQNETIPLLFSTSKFIIMN